jgi:hypothetical protein
VVIAVFSPTLRTQLNVFGFVSAGLECLGFSFRVLAIRARHQVYQCDQRASQAWSSILLEALVCRVLFDVTVPVLFGPIFCAGFCITARSIGV